MYVTELYRYVLEQMLRTYRWPHGQWL